MHQNFTCCFSLYSVKKLLGRDHLFFSLSSFFVVVGKGKRNLDRESLNVVDDLSNNGTYLLSCLFMYSGGMERLKFLYL